MLRRPPRSTRTDTLFPYTTLFRSLVIARCVKIALGIDELLVLGADPPAFLRLLAAREAVDELRPVFDHRRVAVRHGLGRHLRAVGEGAGRREIRITNRPRPPSTRRPSPRRRWRRAGCAGHG